MHYQLDLCQAELFKDQFIRDLTKDLQEEMTKRNLCVTGEPLVIFLPSVLKTCCTKIWIYTM